jgi:hypothetical protein
MFMRRSIGFVFSSILIITFKKIYRASASVW